MPVEIRPGDVVPVPCRSCGKILKLRIEAGESSLDCPSCNRTTHTNVVVRATGIQLFTSLVGKRPSRD